MPPILEVNDVRLSYRIIHRQNESLKRAVFNALTGRGGGRASWFEALRGVSFSLERGEVLGVCGHNGSGKSTLLRVLSGIMPPTSGEVVARGRVGSLLSLAGGFHPESTGRDNIYLNCLLYGISPDEIEAKTPSILEFAELGTFIDAPVRTYSTGMRARLGFAIAAHVEADILLVDETLSVGDAHFQSKCEHWIERRLRDGVSIVIVSHDLPTLSRIAHRFLWLHKGTVGLTGSPDYVMTQYWEWVKSLEPDERPVEMQRRAHDVPVADVAPMAGPALPPPPSSANDAPASDTGGDR